MPNPLAVTLHALGQEAADGASSALDLGTRRLLTDIILDVSAITGADPSLECELQTSSSTTGGWRNVKTFPKATVLGPLRLPLALCDRYARVAWFETPAVFTFSVTATAVQLYVVPEDVIGPGKVLPAKMVGKDVTQDDIVALCLQASSEAEGYLDAAYELPLVSWGVSLPSKLACMVASDILGIRGVVGGGIDPMIVKQRDDAVSWLNKIARGVINPPDIVDQSPDVEDEGAYVTSQPKRGWAP